MTILQIIDAFTFYGIDVILLAALTAITVQIFKVTFLKKLKRKLLTFLPFIIGTLFYAAYVAAVNCSICYIIKEHISVLEHGISVGALATLLYVMYEQFVRDKKSASPAEGVIATLIDGYVPDGRTEEVASLIAEAIQRDVTGDGAIRAAEILTENSAGEINERDIKLLSKLIIETLAHVNLR
ncbi:MAG: hypothetical protein K2K80_01950 [Clostridia bacterium]|nr:hypothetical protein [Clostridia bacterium]